MATPLALVWELIAKDNASATFARVGDSAALNAEKTAGFTEGLAKIGEAAGLAAVAVGVVSLKMAADYQTSVTKLVTTAGESKDAIGMVSQGMLDMAGQVGISATDLAKGMYIVESAGIHGAGALDVLKASAEGAKQEGADLAHVADAVSTALHDYHLPASDAANVTSQLITAVSHGKTNFDEFTAALHSVTPIASAAGVSLADATGVLSSMTASGMSAEQAAQNLGSTIKRFSGGGLTQPMIQELGAVGISAQDLVNNLGDGPGKTGLAATLQKVSTAIMEHMGPSGTVLLNTFNQSTQAGHDAQRVFDALPPAAQKVAQAINDGTLSYKDFRKTGGGLAVEQRTQIGQWASLHDKATGFSQALKSGSADSQNYVAALAKATGGQEALSVMLQSTGENAAATNAAIKDIAGSSAQADGNIKGWSEVQGNFNQKLSEVVAGTKSWFIELGQHLLPVATEFLKVLQDNATVVKIVAAVVGGALVVALVAAAAAFVAANAVIIAISAAISALAVGVIYAYTHFQTFRDIVDLLGRVIADTWAFIKDETEKLWPVVVSTVKDAIDWIKNAWNDLSADTETLWNKVSGWVMTAVTAIENFIAPLVVFVHDHWDEIKQVTEFVWGEIKAYFDIIWGLIKSVFDVVLPLIEGIMDTAWSTIKTAVQVAWDLILGILKLAWDSIKGGFEVFRDVFIGIVSVFLDVVTGHWSKAWDDIKTAVVNIWGDIQREVGSIAHDFAAMLSGIFSDLAIGLEHIWSAIWNTAKSTFVGGINGVLDVVDGFLSAINDIAGAVGLTLHLNVAHVGGGGDTPSGSNNGSGLKTGSSTAGLAQGGTVGDGFTTNGPQVIVGEGNPAHPEFVIPTDPTYRVRARELYGALGSNLGMPGLAGGGVLGDIVGGIKGAASSAWTGIKDVAGAAEHIAKEGLAKVLEAAWPVLPTDNSIGALLPGGINHVRDAAIKFIEDKDTANKKAAAASSGAASGGPPGSMPSGDLAGWEATALGILGKDYGTFTPGLSTLIGFESGGNPNAINLTDSNAQAGHPSKGLMQTIDGTFNSYALPGHGNIYDPVDNIIAGFRYAEATYGDGMIASGGRRDSSGGYLGYDRGGLLMPGFSQVYNGHNEPEIITPPGAGQFGGKDVIVNVYSQPGQSGEQIALEVKRQLLFEMR